MRIAVISDIHGNCLALEAVLADIERRGADMTLNLGDMLSGPLEPRRTAELLMECDFPSVLGNHERNLLSDRPLDAVDRFARDDLEAEHMAWLGDFPATLSIGTDVFMCHGTPKNDRALWVDNWFEGRTTTLPTEEDVIAKAAGVDFEVMLCGHTHVPRAVRLSDGRMVVNPGSVGLQTYYGAPDARYATIERRNGKWAVDFHMVPYDWHTAATQARTHGFPKWSAPLLGGWAGASDLF